MKIPRAAIACPLAWMLSGLAGCASAWVRPDSESAQAHRAEAASEHQQAILEKRAYDPMAVAQRTNPVADNAVAGGVVVDSLYNPTTVHLRRAEAHEAHVKAHEKAAANLEKFEARECAGITEVARSACPVTGPVSRIEEIPTGVRLYLSEGAPVEATVAMMRCHYAFAETRGFDAAESCPLYIRGLKIQLSQDHRAVELISDTPSVVAEIQRQVRATVNARSLGPTL